METFKVEYLITVDQKDPFCSSTSTFNHFLRSIEGVHISSNVMDFKSLKIQYEVQIGEISIDKQRFFHIKLTCANKEQLETFEYLLKSVRTVLTRASGRIVQVLWDDVGSYYAQLAYPLFHDLENVMRKLITKFMLTTVGLSWTNESMPQEVADSVRSKAQKNTSNYLYETDFIQLSNFLFKEYTSVNTKTFTDKIRLAQKTGDLDLEDFKAIVPRSNWERYFSKVVNCESDYLRIRWEKLYDKRNHIAHNKPINRMDFEETVRLIDEVKPKLQEAINKLDQIIIPESDREAVAENAAENINALFGEFLRDYNVMSENFHKLATLFASNPEDVREIERSRSGYFHKLGAFNRNFFEKITNLSYFRNTLVHEANSEISGEIIKENIELARQINREILITTEVAKKILDGDVILQSDSLPTTENSDAK